MQIFARLFGVTLMKLNQANVGIIGCRRGIAVVFPFQRRGFLKPDLSRFLFTAAQKNQPHQIIGSGNMKRSPLLLRLGQESAQNMFRRVGFAVFKQSQRLQIEAFETGRKITVPPVVSGRFCRGGGRFVPFFAQDNGALRYSGAAKCSAMPVG